VITFLFSKRKTVVLDCFTPFEIYARDNPVAKSSAFIPNWWRRVPQSVEVKSQTGVSIQMPTMRGCTGFMDLHRYGVMIPLWSDMNIRIADGKFAWHSAAHFDVVSHVATHPGWHYGNEFADLVHLKLVPPWRLKEKNGIRFSVAGYPWGAVRKTPNFHFLSGISDFRSQTTIQANIFATKNSEPYQYDLMAGDPLLHLIPLTDHQVLPRIHVVSEAEFHSMDKSQSKYKFLRWGITQRKIAERRCPLR